MAVFIINCPQKIGKFISNSKHRSKKSLKYSRSNAKILFKIDVSTKNFHYVQTKKSKKSHHLKKKLKKKQQKSGS